VTAPVRETALSKPRSAASPRRAATTGEGRRSSPAATPWTRATLNAAPPVHRPTGPRRAPFVLLVAALLMGGLCLLLALNTAAAAAELRRHGMLDSNASLAAAVQQAQSDLAAREAPGALAAAAATLGMVVNSNPGYLVEQPGGRMVVMGSPAPAMSPAPPAPSSSHPSTAPARPTNPRGVAGRSAAPAPVRSRPTPTPAPTTAEPLPGGAR
jgi:hypothetical protein